MSADLEVDPELMSADPKAGWRRSLSFVRSLVIRGFVVLGIITVLIGLLLPAVRSSSEAGRRIGCSNNLKQIALGLWQYEQTYHALPPAYTVDAKGTPLHSWRTLILPYLAQEPLYKSIDLSKPWNDPANAKALETSLPVFQCPSRAGFKNTTTYLGVVGPNACFKTDRPRPLAEITDSHDLTLMLIETGEENAVPWMAPVDADESLVMNLGAKAKTRHPGGMNGAFVDGSVKFLKYTTPAEVRRALLSISGDDNAAAKEW